MRIRLLCLSIVFLLPALMLGQIYNFRVYGVDEGLPQSYVYSISQTPTGFLNVSTGEGFCSFEGSRFITNTIKDGLQDNFVTTHFSDSRDITWLGHYQKGISYKHKGQYFKIRQSTDLASKVTCFAEDQKRNIWFTTQSKGLFKIDTAFRLIPISSKSENGANSICIDADGNLLEGSPDGLFIYSVSNSGKILTLHQNVRELEGKTVKVIVPMRNEKNSFWVAVDDAGIFGIKMGANGKYTVVVRINDELGLNDHNYTSLYVDNKKNLWVGDFGEGVRKVTFFDPEEISSFTVNKIDDRNGLPNEYIQSIFEDFEGNMWFGSFGGGLIELPLEKFSFFEDKNGLKYKNIVSLFIDREGIFWTGNDKGLFRYNVEFPEQSKRYGSAEGFIDAEVTSIAQDKKGLLWIATRENGVFTYDKKSNRFTDFSRKMKITVKNINSIIVDHKNRILIASTEGVYFYNQETGNLIHYTTMDGLLHNNVVKLFEDSEQRIWFCSNGAGPYYMKNGKFTVFNNLPELKTFSITSITQDNAGTVWLGTEGDGVFSYTKRGFVNYKVSEGLYSNYCYFMITDNGGNLWVGHKNGLSYKPSYLKNFRTYTKTDGLLFTDFNRNSCFRDVSGNLWWGTSNGLIKYNSIGVSAAQSAPKTNIAGLMLNKTFFNPNQPIEVPYDDYSVKVDYIAISFTDPAKVNFKYRLLGQDTIWRYTNSKFIEFPKLNDGEYTFQLLAANSDNVWNEKPAQVSFVVKPPYWKRAWFYSMVILVTVSASFSVTRYRTKSLVEAKMILEKKVFEKTALLREEKATVERIKSMLEVKNKNVTDSINYAQRIQASILPTESSIKNVFENSFIYYKPRDIVSGDFYWFAETEDSYLIAAVDCTGHGIPGAFMSLVGSTLLNELVNNKKYTKPSDILSKLNTSIIKVLRQKADYNSSHDGMDMALCSISKSKDSLLFGGALRPLYHIRANVLTELKGNPYFIGGYYENMIKEFKDEELKIQKGDMIYLFSDGYSDQFGEENTKKFSTKRFKKLLTDISGKSIDEQYKLLDNAFNEWKGKEDQIDDVLVIAIQI